MPASETDPKGRSALRRAQKYLDCAYVGDRRPWWSGQWTDDTLLRERQCPENPVACAEGCGYIGGGKMPVTHNNGNLPQALATMKVLDLTHYVAGPFCTKLLADYGAEVIKIERPGQGDPGRRLGPFPEDKPRPDSSGLFSYLNGNKLGITLDLKHAAGVGICKELVRWADVVVESFRPGVMAGYGLSYGQLSEAHPGVIVTSLSNFGQSGPYRDYKASEIIEYAIGGPMLFTGTSNREPLKLGGRVGMIFAGQEAAMATLMAFYREMGGDGGGDHVDVSIMETQAGSIDRQTALLVNYQYTGNRYSRPDASEAYLGGVYPALDGYLDVQVIERFPQLLAAMGQPDTITESEAVELAIFLDKWENADGNPLESGELIKELGVMLEKWVRARPMGPAWAQFQRHGTLSASFNDAAGVHADPSFSLRGLWTKVEGAESGLRDCPGAFRYWSARPGRRGDRPRAWASTTVTFTAGCSDTAAGSLQG